MYNSSYRYRDFIMNLRYVFFLILPLGIQLGFLWVSRTLFLWVLFELLLLFKNYKQVKIRPKLWSVLPILLFFIWNAISLTYSEDLRNGIKVLEHKLLMFFLPLMIIFRSKANVNSKLIKQLFVIGFFLTLVYPLLSYGFLYIFGEGIGLERNSFVFFANYMSRFKHPAYLLLSGCVAYVFYWEWVNEKAALGSVYCVIFGSVLMLLAVMVDSRIGIVVVLVIFVLSFVMQRVKKRIVLLVLFALSIMFLIVIFFNWDVFFETLLKIDPFRFELWKNAISIWKDNFWGGSGIGDAANLIGESIGIKRYSAHNQYLQILTETGIFGGVFFIVSFSAFFNKQYSFSGSVLLLIVFCFMMFTESIIDRVQGMALYGFVIWIIDLSSEKGIHNAGIPDKVGKQLCKFIAIVPLVLLFVALILIKYKNRIDPIDAKTYASRICTIVPHDKLPLPLPGGIEEITAYKMDFTCDADTWNGNAYSYTCVGKENFKEKDSLQFTVYCFVSINFNGNWVKISAEAEGIKVENSYYDLSDKGKWQELKINSQASNSSIAGYLYFAMYGQENFDSLTGYVIFAYPKFELIK